MNERLDSNSDKERIDYLEAKCSYLCGKLAETITRYTDEGRIRVDLAATPVLPIPHPAPTQRYTEAEMTIVGAFHSILGRFPSDGDLVFYTTTLSKHGRSRLVRDIFLSPESVNSNTIPPLLTRLLRFFWVP